MTSYRLLPLKHQSHFGTLMPHKGQPSIFGNLLKCYGMGQNFCSILYCERTLRMSFACLNSSAPKYSKIVFAIIKCPAVLGCTPSLANTKSGFSRRRILVLVSWAMDINHIPPGGTLLGHQPIRIDL